MVSGMGKTAFITLSILLIFAANINSAERIRITNGEWAPYLSEHLPKNGFASDIVREVFARMGIEVIYGFFPWKRSYHLAQKGHWDGTVVWVRTPERERDFVFSNTVVTDNEYLFHLKTFDLNWTNVDDLKGLTIGGTLHTVYPLFDRAEQKGLLIVERTGTYENLYRRLLRNRIHAVPQVSEVGKYLIRTTLPKADQSKITYSPTIIQTRQYSLMISKTISGSVELISRFNDSLESLYADGTYARMHKQLQNRAYDLKEPTK